MTHVIVGASHPGRPWAALALAIFVAGWMGCGGESDATEPTPSTGAGPTTSTTVAGGGGAGAAAGAPAGGTGGHAGVGGAGGSAAGGGGSGGTGPTWPDELASLAELDLGTWPVGELGYFPIPEHTLGFTVLVEAPSAEDIIGVFQLRSPPPSSSVIYEFAMTGHDMQIFGDAGWCTCADPMSDSPNAVPVREGNWALRLGSDGNVPEATVRVWARRTSDGAFHGGVVDVNVYLAPATVEQSYLTTVLETHLFPYAGLELGTVTFHALGAASSSIDSMDEYRELLASSAGTGTAPALNLFVVGHFGGELAGALGVAGGIPGSPMQHGTARSGLAYTPTGDPSYDGTILAHEMGHVAGLFHTTELELEETDPLSDTAECAYATIQSNPNSCPDQSNLMFPIAYGGTLVSAAQLRVIEGSALYRGVLSEGGQPEPPLPWPAGAVSTGPLDPRLALAGRGGIVARRARAPRDELERLLGAHWCVRGGDASAVALRLAGDEPVSLLVRIVEDATAFDVARGRALGLLARLPSAAPSDRARLVSVASRAARRASSGRQLRLVALGLLEALAPAELAAVAAALPRGTDALVDAELGRLGLR